MQAIYARSQRLDYVPLDARYAELYQKWINDPEVSQYLVPRLPVNRVQEEDWLRNLPKGDLVLMLWHRKDDRPVGNCGLHRICSVRRSAEFGIVIGEKEYWSRGLGGEACRELLRIGFERLNLHRIELRVHEYNQRGIRAYERAGYQYEGRQRQAHYHAGRYWDILCYSMLAGEYFERYSAGHAREARGSPAVAPQEEVLELPTEGDPFVREETTQAEYDKLPGYFRRLEYGGSSAALFSSLPVHAPNALRLVI